MENLKEEMKKIIAEKFCNESECARALGWPRQRLNKITSGSKEPTVSELMAISDVVDQPVAVLANIFLLKWSPNG